MTDRSRIPTSRPVVAAYAALILLVLAGLVGAAYMLRLEHPATGPLTPEAQGAPDSLRQEVLCPLQEGREGEPREEVLAEPALPQEVTSNELYDCPQTWDGRRVLYTGEVVGALLERGPLVWAQLNDDVYGDQGAPLPTHRDFRGGNAGIGVLLTADMARQVEWIGGPALHGDVAQITGQFVRVDEPTGEVTIIRAESFQILRSGRQLDIPTSRLRPIVAAFVALMALVVTVVEKRARSRP
ncbi:MAG: hypothetical protein ACR2HR_13965 [Euzebya sp.]